MSNTSLLIIDDEISVLEGLQLFLEDEGYDVLGALGGQEGLKTFKEKRPDLVITDLKMPGRSGIDVISEIRKVDRQTPIVVLTGYGTLDSAIQAIRLQVFDFVTKPVELDVLKQTLDRARAARRAAKQVEREMEQLHNQIAQLRNHLAEQQTKLLETEPMIQSGKLLTGILHELNNPLTYIMGESELLQAVHPDVANVRAIHQQAVRMNMIISSMTRRLKDSLVREQLPLQLKDVLNDEVLLLSTHPAFRGDFEVDWDEQGELPVIFGCATDFVQIFGNLLRNAVEAVRESEEKRILIRTHADASGIYISIEDTGPGVPEQLRKKIFEPFFTTKAGNKEAAGSMGMGIGLYHCCELLKNYGGKITCKNSRRGGACFEVHLPPNVIYSESDERS